MAGEEASFFVLCDGEDALPIGTAQDHKRVGEGDTGPNTGGMGAYSPAPVLTDAVAHKVMTTSCARRWRNGAARHALSGGALCRADDRGGQPRLVEYNVRFGDPECQVLMMRLGRAGARPDAGRVEGRWPIARSAWAERPRLTVVMAAKGYPDAGPEPGGRIGGLDVLCPSEDSSAPWCSTPARRDAVGAAAGRMRAKLTCWIARRASAAQCTSWI